VPIVGELEGKHDHLAACRVFFHAAMGFRDPIEMKDQSDVEAGVLASTCLARDWSGVCVKSSQPP
jgi:hypothetical protein